MDPLLQSLIDDLRATMTALNELYHPVYPATPARIAEFEARCADLRQAIATRKRQLAA